MVAKRISVHCVEIEDAPGSLQRLLQDLASAGVDLLCLTAFSAGGGRGRVCLSAKDPQALEAFAENAGIKAETAAGFVLTDDDKVGAAAQTLKGLAEGGINGVAGAAMVCDGRYHMLLVVAADDGDAAANALGA